MEGVASKNISRTFSLLRVFYSPMLVWQKIYEDLVNSVYNHVFLITANVCGRALIA